MASGPPIPRGIGTVIGGGIGVPVIGIIETITRAGAVGAVGTPGKGSRGRGFSTDPYVTSDGSGGSLNTGLIDATPNGASGLWLVTAKATLAGPNAAGALTVHVSGGFEWPQDAYTNGGAQTISTSGQVNGSTAKTYAAWVPADPGSMGTYPELTLTYVAWKLS